MLSNNKFLGKCWYGGHPWIRLAMESESMVKKEYNLFSVWEPPMIYLAWKVLGALSHFRWWEKYASQNVFISQFLLWALAPLQIPTSLCEGPIFYFSVFTFMQESKYFSLFLFIFSFGKHHVVRKVLGTYIQLDMGGHELLLLTSWYVSNVSIIFDCSMLLYYPFWMFMGFILHIIYHFWD